MTKTDDKSSSLSLFVFNHHKYLHSVAHDVTHIDHNI